MDNIILIFPYKVKNIDEFNKILGDFDKQGYYVYLFNDLDKNEFEMDSLYNVIDFYKKQHNNINKVIIMSNVKEIVFSWYRCYNSLADDFIYFIDESTSGFFQPEDELYGFLDSLSKLSDIENESIEGKVYVNLDFNNYNKIWDVLLNKNNFLYFNELKNINYNKKINKNNYNIKKIYLYDENKYCFEYSEKYSEFEHIKLEKCISTNNVNINDQFTNIISQSMYFLKYFIVKLYSVYNKEISSFLVGLLKRLKSLNMLEKEIVYGDIKKYLKREDVYFLQKVYIVSLMICFYPENDDLLKFIMEEILKDKVYFKYHYEILISTLFYINYDGLKIYEDYYVDKKKELELLANNLINNMNFKLKGKVEENKRIAVIVDQLLALKHSPTKVVLDHIINLKKHYNEYEIEVFIEDNLYMKEVNEILPNLYTSAMSEDYIKIHSDYLKNTDIKINYPDMSKNKEQIIKDTIINIDKFNPEVIFSISDISLSSRMLYDYYPIVYLSMGGNYLVNKAHVYLCGNKDEIIKCNKKHNIISNDRIMEFYYGLDFEKPRHLKTREGLKVNPGDFVLISVGNRLYAEFDEEFIKGICEYLENKDDVKWIIVGNCEFSYINENYKELLNSKIVKIAYEQDLMALYDICDAYLNPRRMGGGISIAMAMEQALPIVVFSNPSDGIIYVGTENTCGYSMEEYVSEIERLNEDKEYRKSKSQIMKNRIKEFTFDVAVKKLEEAFQLALDRYNKRIKN